MKNNVLIGITDGHGERRGGEEANKNCPRMMGNGGGDGWMDGWMD
jgi:hypothetical protein